MPPHIRIPVFEKEFLFNIRNEIQVVADEPDPRWISAQWHPEIAGEKIGQLYDSIAEKEVMRLLQFCTCAYCRKHMIKLVPEGGRGILFVCTNCFYWGGRGTRPGGPEFARGNLGRLDFVKNPDDTSLVLLINHLNANTDKLFHLTPRQAEKILPSILSDYLKCEVLAVGGTRDKGIDAIAIRSDSVKILVQIKWRQHLKKAESVSVVREVGGTLLARQVPNGLIISTRHKFSKDAKDEARSISSQEILNVGKLDLRLKDFNDLIDMFEVSSKTRTKSMNPNEVITNYNGGFDLFGQL